jgi:hypothetical protein
VVVPVAFVRGMAVPVVDVVDVVAVGDGEMSWRRVTKSIDAHGASRSVRRSRARILECDKSFAATQGTRSEGLRAGAVTHAVVIF